MMNVAVEKWRRLVPLLALSTWLTYIMIAMMRERLEFTDMLPSELLSQRVLPLPLVFCIALAINIPLPLIISVRESKMRWVYYYVAIVLGVSFVFFVFAWLKTSGMVALAPN